MRVAVADTFLSALYERSFHVVSGEDTCRYR
jgi:hypothetical protein